MARGPSACTRALQRRMESRQQCSRRKAFAGRPQFSRGAMDFSIPIRGRPFGAAVALMYRAAGLEQFTEENLGSSVIRKLMERVVLLKDIRIEKNFPAEWATHVEVLLKDGRILESWLRHPKGDPQNPLTWD